MAKIEVYSGNYCPYCVRAKNLLKEKNLDFEEYDVQSEPERREEMARRAPGVRTIPQIFINDRHVGGCDDLYALERRNELGEWLKYPTEE